MDELLAAPVEITPVRPSPKSGWRTTEFWLALLTTAGGLAGVLAHQIPGTWGGLLAGVSTAAYSLSRGLAKS